MTKGAGEM